MKVDEIETSTSGTYAKLVPTEQTKQKVAEIVSIINVENPASFKELHVTIVYSRKPCPDIKDIPVSLPIVASGESFKLFPNGDNPGSSCLVLKLHSPEMEALHEKCKNEYGATHDHATYDPHITLSYDYPHDQLPNDSLIEYFKGLVFDKYEVEELNLIWSKHDNK